MNTGMSVIASQVAVSRPRTHATVAALAAIVVVASGCDRGKASPSDTAAPVSAPVAEGATQVVAVTAGKDGFVPSHVEVARNRPAKLRFTRNTDQTCATEVAFKELDLKRALPLGEAVDVEIPTGEARTLHYTCGMGMFASTVVVK